MPVDYIYSSRKADDVYHVFFLCHDARDIKEKHKQYGPPPYGRRLCDACRDDMRALLG